MISVVLPVLDGAEQLGQALPSALSAGADEVVVVDGGSSDDSREIAAGFDFVRLLEQQGPELPDAYNEGVAAARGELLGFLGHDDLYEPGALSALEGSLGGAAAVFGRLHYELLGDRPPPGFRSELLGGPRDALLLEAMLAPRSTFERVGVFRHQTAHDVDWLARLRETALPDRAGSDAGRPQASALRERRPPRHPQRARAPAADPPRLDRAQGRAGAMSFAAEAVSVVIPAREREPYLEEAITSAQAERPGEVLVVTPEGGHSAEIADELGARLLAPEERKPQPRRNHGAREARGEVVAFLDADDRFPAGRMTPMLAKLGDAVIGFVRSFVSPDRAEALAGRISVDPERRWGVVCGTLVVRRDAFLSLGGFREDLLAGEMPEWLGRAEEGGLELARIERVVLERRVHGQGHMYAESAPEMRAQYLRLARERILRRRGG